MIRKMTWLGLLAAIVFVSGSVTALAAPGDGSDVFSPLDRDTPGQLRPPAVTGDADDLVPQREIEDNDNLENRNVAPPQQMTPMMPAEIDDADDREMDNENQNMQNPEQHDLRDDNGHDRGAPAMMNPAGPTMPSGNMGPNMGPTNGGNDSRGRGPGDGEGGRASMSPSNSGPGSLSRGNSGEGSRGSNSGGDGHGGRGDGGGGSGRH